MKINDAFPAFFVFFFSPGGGGVFWWRQVAAGGASGEAVQCGQVVESTGEHRNPGVRPQCKHRERNSAFACLFVGESVELLITLN